MNRNEFETWVSGIDLGDWKVNLEKDTLDKNTIGCYINDRGQYVVFRNDAYRHIVKLITTDEREAYDELKANIEEIM